jgi:hypothetical protein
MNYVFMNGQFHHEYDPSTFMPWQRPKLPKQTYVYNGEQRRWFYVRSNRSKDQQGKCIPETEVPDHMRAWILILT